MTVSPLNLLKTGAAPLALSLALVAGPALAQTTPTQAEPTPAEQATAAQQPTATATPTEQSDVIVVTGSRLAPTLTAPNPVQIVGEAQIKQSGQTNIQDVLLKNPVFGSPGISRTNSNFSTSSAGVATVDLRNLGSDRTLVLVNGRRFVPGIPGTATVDLNVIPTQFLERVDVLTGGSSAIYGSDAVAGVVNFITKKNFNGIEFGGKMGLTQRGDGLEREVNVTMGHDFADGKGNVIAFAGYSDQGAVYSAGRSRSAVDQFSEGYLTGEDAKLFTPFVPYYSSVAPQGRFFVGPQATQGNNQAQQFTFDANGNLIQGFSPNGSATRAANGFNRSAYRSIAIPTERYVLALQGNYAISDAVNAYLEGNYASTSTTTRLEPFPLDSAGNNGIFPATGGRFNIEGYAYNPTTGARTLTRNPLVPIEIYNAATDTNGDGLKDMGFTKRLSDFGPRGNTAQRDTFRVLGGLNGAITDNWKWDVYYGYGQTTENQKGNGQVNVVNFANALNVVQDVYDLNGNGSTADAICADANARAQGCTPANIYGWNLMSPEAVKYISASTTVTSKTQQTLAGAGVTGDVHAWGSKPIGLALGVEYRKEAASQIFDALTNQGLNGGNKLDNTEGSFNVVEGYGEARIPIIADQPFFKLLELSVAGRVSHYSTIGDTFSYNVSGVWSPIADIRFRGGYASSVRAPNVGELFGGSGQTFPTGIKDPCLGVTATSTTATSARCRADAGVMANITQNGVFKLTQADTQGISGLNTSNPTLKQEKSESWTAGVVINPRSINGLQNLQLTADYFDISIKDAIVSVPRNYALTQCYEQNVSQYCSLITRRPSAAGANSAGSLDFVNSTLNNSGGLKTRGIDLTAKYSLRAGNLGRMFFDLSYTHLLEGYSIPLPGAPKDYFAGELGAAKDRATGTIGLDNDDWGLTLSGTYIGASYLDDQFTGKKGGTEGTALYRVAPMFYLDSQVRFHANPNFEMFVGAQNLLDKAPPPVISGLPGNTTGAETDASVYDPLGRRFYVGARVKF